MKHHRHRHRNQRSAKTAASKSHPTCNHSTFTACATAASDSALTPSRSWLRLSATCTASFGLRLGSANRRRPTSWTSESSPCWKRRPAKNSDALAPTFPFQRWRINRHHRPEHESSHPFTSGPAFVFGFQSGATRRSRAGVVGRPSSVMCVRVNFTVPGTSPADCPGACATPTSRNVPTESSSAVTT